MAKTSQQTQTQKNEVDPALAAEYGQNTQLARFLGSMGYQPNRAVTIAGMTPAQEASFASTQNAASAFGMPTAASTGAPATETSAGGIKGYSTGASYDEAIGKLPAEFQNSMKAFYEMLGKGTGPGGAATGTGTGGKATGAGGTGTASKSQREDGNTGALDRVPSNRPKANPRYSNSSSGSGNFGNVVKGAAEGFATGGLVGAVRGGAKAAKDNKKKSGK